MPTVRRRIRVVVAVIVAAAMTATTMGPAPDADAQTAARAAAAGDAAGFDWAALVPTAASLHSVAAGLPDDPISASEQLVEILWGADSLAAVSAAGEILRRAGLPLVSADGPVMALPDGNVITNVPILVEFLPTLTDTARNGTFYRPSQLGELLQGFGFARELPTDREVVGLLAAWGKGDDDIPEVRAAGASARALARIRGELLIPAAIPTPEQEQQLADDPDSVPEAVIQWLTSGGVARGIDPITAVLLLAHSSGELATGAAIVPAGSGLRTTESGALLPRAGGVNCDEMLPEQTSRADQERESAIKEAAKQQTRSAAADAAERYGDASGKYGEGKKKWVEWGGEAYDKAADAVSVVMLMLGAKLELKSDKSTTHFRHGPGERAKDVTVTATASFSSALAKRHLRCWALVGIEVPPDGPLKDYKINWRLSKAPHAFQAFSESAKAFAKGGTTDRDGTSEVSIYPRTELTPPKDGEQQPEVTINAKVYAGLDKDEFPWKFADLLDMASSANMGYAAAKALYNLLLSMIKRGALPTKSLSIPVTYHGQRPFVMHGAMQAKETISQISIDLRADLYSCSGPLGPWQGTVGAGGDVQIKHTGSAPQIIGGGQGDFPLRFQLAETGSQQRFHVSDGVGLQVELDVDAVATVLRPKTVSDTYDEMKGRSVVVGTGTWTLEGKEIAKALGAAQYMKWASGTERFDVVSKKSDERCGGSTYWNGSQFDRTERG